MKTITRNNISVALPKGVRKRHKPAVPFIGAYVNLGGQQVRFELTGPLPNQGPLDKQVEARSWLIVWGNRNLASWSSKKWASVASVSIRTTNNFVPTKGGYLYLIDVLDVHDNELASFTYYAESKKKAIATMANAFPTANVDVSSFDDPSKPPVSHITSVLTHV